AAVALGIPQVIHRINSHRRIDVHETQGINQIADDILGILESNALIDRYDHLRQDSTSSGSGRAHVAQSIFQSGNIVSVVLISDVILLGGITQISSQLNRVTGSRNRIG